MIVTATKPTSFYAGGTLPLFPLDIEKLEVGDVVWYASKRGNAEKWQVMADTAPLPRNHPAYWYKCRYTLSPFEFEKLNRKVVRYISVDSDGGGEATWSYFATEEDAAIAARRCVRHMSRSSRYDHFGLPENRHGIVLQPVELGWVVYVGTLRRYFMQRDHGDDAQARAAATQYMTAVLQAAEERLSSPVE